MFFETKVKMWQLWKKYVLNAFKSGRESYPLGWVKVTTVDEIESKLLNIGFQPNYFSFGDEGQITSMRRMYVDNDGYWRQEHVRVHQDGEVRGHDELSYEESAIGHVKGEEVKEINVNSHMGILLVLGGTYKKEEMK